MTVRIQWSSRNRHWSQDWRNDQRPGRDGTLDDYRRNEEWDREIFRRHDEDQRRRDPRYEPPPEPNYPKGYDDPSDSYRRLTRRWRWW
jgi:hypothetical protein